MLAGLICPDGQKIKCADCLKQCRMGDPCLSPETIKMVVATRDRPVWRCPKCGKEKGGDGKDWL